MTIVNTQESSEKPLSLYEVAASIEPRSIPKAPQEMLVFRNLSLGDRNKKSEGGASVSDNFYRQEFIKEYMDKKWRAELHNKTGFLFIWEGFIRMGKQDKKEILRAQLGKFRDAIISNDHEYIALHTDFGKYLFGGTPVGQAKKVCDMFGGTQV